MKFGPSSSLGISIGDRAITCAEVAPAGGGKKIAGARRVVQRVATFAIPEGMSLDKPQPLGQAFAAFLRENGFGSAGRAAVGVPAKWLIAIEKDVPPAPLDQAHAVLRLQAERLAVSESGEMIFDYAGTIDPARANKVLLVGLPKKRLEQVEEILKAADLAEAAVTSSALTLARAATTAAAATADADLPMLLLSRQGGEIVARHDGGAPRMLRHVGGIAINGHGPVAVSALGSELGRTLMLTRVNGMPAARELLLWDDVGLAPAQLAELAERSGLRVRPGDPMSVLGLQPAPVAVATRGAEVAPTQTFAPALALALAASDRRLLAVDFARSRLVAQTQRRVGRTAVLAIIAGVLGVAAIISLYVDVQRRQSTLDDIKQQVAAKAEDVKSARAVATRVTYAETFFGNTRPPYLNCLKELSDNVFRDNEPDIWTTSVVLHANRKGQIIGKTTNSDRVNILVGRLKQNPKFTEVTREWHDVGGGAGGAARVKEYTFTITFNYVAPE